MLKQVEASGKCPCCGQGLPVIAQLSVNLDYNTVTRNGVCVGLEPQSAALLYALNRQWPGQLVPERLIQAMYGRREACCDDPMKVIKVRVSRMRRQLAPLGVSIIPVYGSGYRLQFDVAP